MAHTLAYLSAGFGYLLLLIALILTIIETYHAPDFGLYTSIFLIVIASIGLGIGIHIALTTTNHALIQGVAKNFGVSEQFASAAAPFVEVLAL